MPDKLIKYTQRERDNRHPIKITSVNAGAINALPCNFQLIAAAICCCCRCTASAYRFSAWAHGFPESKKATKAQTIRSNTQRSITAATTTATPNSRLTCLPIFFFVSVSCNLRIGKYRVCHSLNSGLSDFVCLLFFLPSLSTRLQSHAHCLKIVSSFLKLLA